MLYKKSWGKITHDQSMTVGLAQNAADSAELNFHVSTLQEPTAITDACFANFLGPNSLNLVVTYNEANAIILLNYL